MRCDPPPIGVAPFTLGSVPTTCTCGAVYWFKAWEQGFRDGPCPGCGNNRWGGSDNAAHVWYVDLVSKVRESTRRDLVDRIERWGEEHGAPTKPRG